MPVADHRLMSDQTGLRIAIALEAIGGSGNILTPAQTIPIPASGSSASYSMDGLTSDHELVRWNFSASAENIPPANLTWTTYNGYFTITNTSGSTSESIRPVFALPDAIAISAR